MQSLRTFSTNLLKLYRDDFKGINLTRILDEDQFYHKQIVDSLLPFEEIEFLQNLMLRTNLILDIGFGGGFPLLPLAYKYPDKDFFGFEAREKKVKVVAEIAQKIGLNNVSTYHKRSEDLLIDIPCLITFKAVGSVQLCLDQLNCSTDVTVLFYKGPDYENEAKDLKLDKTWSVKEKQFFELPHGEKRTIVIFSKNVPRGTSPNFKKNNISKLSEIIDDTER